MDEKSRTTQPIAGSFLPPWIFTVIVSLGIIWLTLGKPPMPDFEEPLWEHTDKVVHAVMFGSLFFVLCFDWYRRRGGVSPRYFSMAVWAFVAWSALGGAVIELAQPYFGRTCDFLDFAADLAGVLLAWSVTPPVLRLLRKAR